MLAIFVRVEFPDKIEGRRKAREGAAGSREQRALAAHASLSELGDETRLQPANQTIANRPDDHEALWDPRSFVPSAWPEIRPRAERVSCYASCTKRRYSLFLVGVEASTKKGPRLSPGPHRMRPTRKPHSTRRMVPEFPFRKPPVPVHRGRACARRRRESTTK